MNGVGSAVCLCVMSADGDYVFSMARVCPVRSLMVLQMEILNEQEWELMEGKEGKGRERDARLGNDENKKYVFLFPRNVPPAWLPLCGPDGMGF